MKFLTFQRINILWRPTSKLTCGPLHMYLDCLQASYYIMSKRKKIVIPKAAVISLWIFSTIVGLMSMFSITFFFLGPFTSLESALYAGLHRLGWSFFTGWLVISVATDNAGFLKSFLSSSIFNPLSRLTYCAYLSNGIVELYQLGTLRAPVYMSHIRLVSFR